MPGVARLYDICTGHVCWPPRPNVMASTNTFVNNRGVHRQTDLWMVHCCGLECHPGILALGSPNVFTNNLQTGRCFDPVNCGSLVLTCSPNVIANG